MAHTLNIIKDGQTLNSFHVDRKQYATVPVKGGTQFQIMTEDGKLVSNPKVKVKGNDLWVFLEKGSDLPDIVLENYAAFKPVDSSLLKGQNTTFAMTNKAGSPVPASAIKDTRDAALAKEADTAQPDRKFKSIRKSAHESPNKSDYADKTNSSDNHSEKDYNSESVDSSSDSGYSMYAIAGGIVAIGLVGWGISKIIKGGDDNTIVIDNVTSDNKLDSTDTLTANIAITGTADADNGKEISLEIGETKINSTVIDGKFSFDVDADDLTSHDSVMVKMGDTKAYKGYDVDDSVATLKTFFLDPTVQGTVVGTAGDDYILSSSGADVLTSGEGRDVFIFNSVLDGTFDALTDFTVGEDIIALSPTIFTGLDAGNISDHLSYENNVLSYDADGAGAGAAVPFATFHATDFDLLQSVYLIG